MADEDLDPGVGSVVVGTGGSRSTDMDPGGSPYPHMTPGPPKAPILKTSFQSVPSDTRTAGEVWDDGVRRMRESAERIGTEMNQTYRDTPPVVGPAVREAFDNAGWVGRNVLHPLASAADFVGKEGSAIGAGAIAAGAELLGGGDPQRTRDAHEALQILPIVKTMMPRGPAPVVLPDRRPTLPPSPPPGGPPGPVSLGQVSQAVQRATPPSWRVVAPGEDPVPGREYRMNQATGQREVNEGGPAEPPNALTIPPPPPAPPPPGPPPERVPISGPADALKVYKPQIQAAEQSDFKLAPQFTQDWVGSLDPHGDLTPAARAANPGGTPVTKLVDDLRNTADAPIDNIKSIQQIDERIQRAISEQSGSGGDLNQVRQMRQILQDFRDRYQNVPADQFTGSPQGIEAFRNSIQSYAAYSRLREVQGIIDGTEGNPNRATLLASRVNGFLNDDRNTKGWTPEEIASLRKAANSGFVAEWMRAQGSRLVGIGSAVAGGPAGAVVGVPAQVGLSYAIRNTAENMRMARLREAMGVLGQRVPQPGAVTTPPPFQPPSSAAMRYAPLTGLLGQTQGQPRDETILPPLWRW